MSLHDHLAILTLKYKFGNTVCVCVRVFYSPSFFLLFNCIYLYILTVFILVCYSFLSIFNCWRPQYYTMLFGHCYNEEACKILKSSMWECVVHMATS